MNEVRRCTGCGVTPGVAHRPYCDVARCLWTGRQRYGCTGGLAADCCVSLRDHGRDDLADRLGHYMDLDDERHDCGYDVWTGAWPGTEDAARLGFWCYGPPWRTCDVDHPDARPDLNRLVVEARWDRAAQRWELAQPPNTSAT